MNELGIGIQSDKRPEQYVGLARRAEAAGFDVISVFHDLLFQPAIYPLLLIAGATERMRLGPAALNPSTLHPVELAGQAAVLDLASDGRAYLGIASGALGSTGWASGVATLSNWMREVQRRGGSCAARGGRG